ncbi:MAG: hypothetical protein QXP62_00685 [Saccharolobus sp.]
MMILPKFTLYKKLELPEAACWLEHDDSFKITCDVIKQPKILIKDDYVSIDSGEWIFRRGNKLILVDENGKEKVIREDNDNYVADYISLGNEINPIYMKNGKYIYNSEEYNKYISYFGKKILINKKKVIIFIKNKEIVLENIDRYYVSRKYISVLYGNTTTVIDNDAKILTFQIRGKYLGFESLYGDIFESENGLIISSRRGNIGICANDAYLVGEFSGGLLILCGDRLKYYYNSGWREIERYIDSEFSVNSNKNYFGIIKSGNILYIYDDNFNKFFKFDNVYSYIFNSRWLYLLSTRAILGIIQLSEDEYNPLKVINRNNTFSSPVIIGIADNYFHKFTIQDGLILDTKTGADGYKLVMIEPIELKKGIFRITIGNDFYSIQQEISYESDRPNVEFYNIKLLVSADNGKLIENPDKNSLLSGTIKYSIPTHLPIKLSINVLDQTYMIQLDKNSSEEILRVPLKLKSINSDKIPVRLDIYAGQRVIDSFEYMVPVVIVQKPKLSYKLEKRTIINNSMVKNVIIRKDDMFQWEEIFEYPLDYQGVVIARVGDIVKIDGEKINVNKGYNYFKITKENYSKEYLILGIVSPINEVNVRVHGDSIIVNANIDSDIPFEIFYGTHSYRGVSRRNNEIVFPLEPTYNSIKIRAFSHGFKWEVIYNINSLKVSLINAVYNSKQILEYLHSFGIV